MDAGLAYPAVVTQPLQPQSPGAWVIRGVVSLHQMLLSEAEASRSHFRPSSSQYMLLAVQKYGWLDGYLRGMDRLMRENEDPWIYSRLSVTPDSWIKWDPP
ncbi:MAG: membrane protein insertion efficiency factor YidD [Chlamydiia bacterium]